MKASVNKFGRFLYWFVLASFIVPVVFLIFRLLQEPSGDASQEGLRTKADYLLMLVQCLLGAVALHVPQLLRNRLRLEIPAALQIMYVFFLYCAVFLGEVRNFYYKVPHWDKWLHAFSAVMAGSLGFIIADVLNNLKGRSSLTPLLLAVFAFCFAVSIGVLWEIYEYSVDGLLELNMQKFRLEDGTDLVGRIALKDTMNDIIIDVFGSLFAAVTGYFAVKRQNIHAKQMRERTDEMGNSPAQPDQVHQAAQGQKSPGLSCRS